MVRPIPALVAALAFTASASLALAQAPAQDPAPVRVGGTIKAPTKVKNVDPIYPPIARSARQEGVVILALVVGPTGTVQDATVLKSVPLLDQAALDAVKQWEYEPTLVNGVAVPVIYNITVAFSLAKADAAAAASAADSPATSQPVLEPPATGRTPTPAIPATDAQPPAVRVGGVIKAPTKIVNVDPVYPAAVAPGSQGVVILELLIAPQGYVQDARVLRSVPELDQSALDAVLQWVYTPTLLNGMPVPVLYNITVAFSARQ